MADMTPEERVSFLAILDYQKCLNPVIEEAKRRRRVSDGELNRLGFACPAELDMEARKLVARQDYRADEPGFVRLPRGERIAAIKNELAAIAWCELRSCPVL